MHDRHPQDDLLIAAALAYYSSEFHDADRDLADRAWELALEHSRPHGLEPAEAIRQLE